jgi:hypothetical protein
MMFAYPSSISKGEVMNFACRTRPLSLLEAVPKRPAGESARGVAGKSADRTVARFAWPLLLALFVLGLSCLTGCASPQARTDSPAAAAPAQPALVGKWQVENSSAVFEITSTRDGIAISGLDSSDGEAFVITNVKWDGQVLEADFLMPSTHFTTHSRLSLADSTTLSGKYENASPEIWRRIP